MPTADENDEDDDGSDGSDGARVSNCDLTTGNAEIVARR